MIKQLVLCFVVAIAATVAGNALCQNEGFAVHYCALVFITVFGAMVCTCAFWSDFQRTIDGFSEDSKRALIGDNVAVTILAWLLPVAIFLIGVI